MVNLLPKNLREQEAEEHKKALQQKQQESKVSYTRSVAPPPKPAKKKAGGFSWLHKKDTEKALVPKQKQASKLKVKNQPIQRTVQPIVVAPQPVVKPGVAPPAPPKQKPVKKQSPPKPKKDISEIFPFSLFIKKKRSAQKVNGQAVKAAPQKTQQKNKGMQVNLISKDILEDRSNHRSERALIIVGILTVVVLGVLFAGTKYFVDKKISTLAELEGRNTILDAALAQLQATNTEMLILQRRFNSAEELYNNHIYWTRLLDFFEKNTLSSIQYKNLSLNKETPGTYKLDGTASSVEDMLQQWNVFEQSPEVISVGLDRYTRGEQTTVVQNGVPALPVENTNETDESESLPAPQNSAVTNMVDITFSLAIELDPTFLIGLYGSK